MKIMLFFLFLVQNSFGQDFRGRAYKEGILFYIEEHFKTASFKERIDYRDPEGKLVAQMWTDFSRSSHFPEIFFWDRRASLYYGGFHQNQGMRIFSELPLGEMKEIDLEKNKKYLIRPGLFHFILGNSEKLRKDVEFNFIFIFFPSLKLKEFNVSRTDFDEVGVYPRNSIDKLFQPRMSMRFDQSFKRIIEYAGPSEIADDEGIYPRVEIYFDYGER